MYKKWKSSFKKGERKIELANLITGFKERSVGEFVPEHHDYFSKHFNHNPKDCCNLRRG